MDKGLVLGQQLPAYPTTADARAAQALKANVVRFETNPAIDPYGLVKYLRIHAAMNSIVLLNRSLIPRVPLSYWRSPGINLTNTLKAWDIAVSKILEGCVSADFPPYAVETFNEPNDTGTGIPASVFLEVNNIVYQRVKERFPATRVISGGVFAHARSGAEYLNPVGSKLHCDYIGWHPYLDTGGGLQVTNFSKFAAELTGLTHKPLYITETGWDTNVVQPSLQASNITSVLTASKAIGIAGVVVFALEDAPQSNPPLHFGIHGKPAGFAFQAFS